MSALAASSARIHSGLNLVTRIFAKSSTDLNCSVRWATGASLFLALRRAVT